ncbi:MAG: hypothetical protein KC457_25330, partial [Myxococcales bacterium]|nr:hypothetical protein [Myxococcales bacterium]
MSDTTFFPVTREQWQAQAEKDLRGRPLASLTRTTADGIAVSPLYTAEDLERLELPEIAGARGQGQGWLAVQEIRHADPRQANAAALSDLRRGAQGVRFILDGRLQAGREAGSSADGLVLDPHRDLGTLLAGIDPLRTPVTFEAGLRAPALAEALAEWLEDRETDEPGLARSGVLYNPLAPVLRSGEVPRNLDGLFGEQVDATLGSALGLLSISTAPWHDAGAGDVEELALALATCAELLRRGQALGLEIGDLTERMSWTLAVAGRPFEAIAKLRAARALWAKFSA